MFRNPYGAYAVNPFPSLTPLYGVMIIKHGPSHRRLVSAAGGFVSTSSEPGKNTVWVEARNGAVLRRGACPAGEKQIFEPFQALDVSSGVPQWDTFSLCLPKQIGMQQNPAYAMAPQRQPQWPAPGGEPPGGTVVKAFSTVGFPPRIAYFIKQAAPNYVQQVGAPNIQPIPPGTVWLQAINGAMFYKDNACPPGSTLLYSNVMNVYGATFQLCRPLAAGDGLALAQNPVATVAVGPGEIVETHTVLTLIRQGHSIRNAFPYYVDLQEAGEAIPGQFTPQIPIPPGTLPSLQGVSTLARGVWLFSKNGAIFRYRVPTTEHETGEVSCGGDQKLSGTFSSFYMSETPAGWTPPPGAKGGGFVTAFPIRTTLCRKKGFGG